MAFNLRQKIATAFQGVRNRFAQQAAVQEVYQRPLEESLKIRARNVEVARAALGTAYRSQPQAKKPKAEKPIRLRKARQNKVGAYSSLLAIVREIGDRDVNSLWAFMSRNSDLYRSKSHMKKVLRLVRMKHGHFHGAQSTLAMAA